MSYSKETLPLYLTRASQMFLTEASVNIALELAVAELPWGKQLPVISSVNGLFIGHEEVNESIGRTHVCVVCVCV